MSVVSNPKSPVISDSDVRHARRPIGGFDISGWSLYCFLEILVQIEAKELTHKRKLVEAVAYLRTSSSANVGEGKDSDKRQRAAIEAYAKATGYTVDAGDWFYDAAVKGADPVTARPGFAAMLERIAGNGVRIIIVESPDRFARDLAVQLAGHDYLKELGVSLIPASAPDFFLEDTPTAVLVRQVLGAIAQFDKATTVAKLKAARDRKREATGKCEGRKSYAEANPEMVGLAEQLSGQYPRMSLRQISTQLAESGYRTPRGLPFSASAVASMLGR
jgi:DNA invertase Pin-like site-specific DNA recombinase